ncbi:MAG TPA: 23S rRNA (uracil(1939)-C(5))-methyltransferase RlmD [Terriglobales bacterium]|nr:23S rRNA (uracil(1939)-C(5))-methyltransferase RlmD [Terriglobales bacterium]
MRLTVEKLIYGGDGLARLPADEHGRGKAAFLPFVAPGEQVEAELVEDKPGFARARAREIVAPAPERITPACPYFTRCGGCHYQHLGYEAQLAAKVEILRETLRRTAKLEWSAEIRAHASPPWEYRNRTRLRVRTAPEFALGYNRFGSSELEPVEKCPISSPLVQRGIGVMWELGRAGRVREGIREIEFFADTDDARMLVTLLADARIETPAEADGSLAEAMRSALPSVVGVVVAPARPVSADPWEASDAPPSAVFGAAALACTVRGREYHVGAGSFFQTNRFLAGTLVETALKDRRGALAFDLYAGVGLFTAPLAAQFERVVAVESSTAACRDLRHNAPANVKWRETTAAEFLERATARPDFIIADPPRAGLGEKVARALGELAAPRLTYVSCDPATLSRDLRLLLESGYRVEEVSVLDLFPQTFHIESVVQLVFVKGL